MIKACDKVVLVKFGEVTNISKAITKALQIIQIFFERMPKSGPLKLLLELGSPFRCF